MMRIIDVHHTGRPRVIGCWEVDGWLVDPGPESSLETLIEGLDGLEPRGILLTHIHFDHAGATGALLERYPGIPVLVHERGARHLADPSRLVASATRLYGEDGMRELWGRVMPVAEESMTALKGGERLHGFRIEYTPGHASHHVCYLHEDSGMAFVGDVAGVRIDPVDLVVAPTPPPDIDLEAWDDSLQILRDWQPAALGLTHFGRVDDVAGQLDALHAALHEQAEKARELDLEQFTGYVRRRVEEATDPESAAAFLQAAPADHLWYGLTRYWELRGAGGRHATRSP